jgi:hypothetical protein
MEQSIVLSKFLEHKKIFDSERMKEEGSEIMKKIVLIINDLGSNFSDFNGTDLAERQMKLAGYKFYLSEYLSELQRISEALKIEIKNIRAEKWGDIIETLKATGQKATKDSIENQLQIDLKDILNEQILYETMYYQYKLKLSAIDDILTAIVQQIASKKRDIEIAKQLS